MREYKGVIFTDHALQRLRERNISQGDAWATLNRPEQSREGSNDKGSWVYYRTYGTERIEVVAKKNDKGEWIVLSVWSRPVYQQGGQHHHKQGKAKDPFIVWFVKWIFNKHK